MKKEQERFSESNIFEGLVSLRALIANQERKINGEVPIHDRVIEEVFYDPARQERKKKEYAWLSHRAEALGFTVALTPRVELDAIAIGNTHGGVLARCSGRTLTLASQVDPIKNGFYVMLDGIEDPYNFGYALRSLYAAGVDGILLPERNWMTAAGVVCRASAGASEMLPMFTVSSSDDLRHFKEQGYTIVCADIRDSVPLYDADLSRPILLTVGGEKRGISASFLNLADVRVRIDYARDFDASLSAASAATVVGYEIYRQNRKP